MTTAGSTLALSATLPATYDATGYNALSWTVVGEVTDLGEAGKAFNTVNHSPVGSRRIIKLKGSFNNGSLQFQFGRDFSDAGQTAFLTALGVDTAYSFRMVLQNGKKLYFTGLVMDFKYKVGSVDQVTAASSTVELVSDIVEV
jgi:hypothetical protein